MEWSILLKCSVAKCLWTIQLTLSCIFVVNVVWHFLNILWKCIAFHIVNLYVCFSIVLKCMAWSILLQGYCISYLFMLCYRKYLRDVDRQVLAKRAFFFTVKVLEDNLDKLTGVWKRNSHLFWFVFHFALCVFCKCIYI